MFHWRRRASSSDSFPNPANGVASTASRMSLTHMNPFLIWVNSTPQCHPPQQTRAKRQGERLFRVFLYLPSSMDVSRKRVPSFCLRRVQHQQHPLPTLLLTRHSSAPAAPPSALSIFTFSHNPTFSSLSSRHSFHFILNHCCAHCRTRPDSGDR